MSPRHIWVATRTEVKRIWNDKAQLFIYIVGPVILCLIMGFVANRSPEDVDVTLYVNNISQPSSVANERTQQLIEDIDASSTFSTFEVSSPEVGMQRLDKGDTRAVITLVQGEAGLEGVDVVIDITDPLIQQTVRNELTAILGEHSTNISLELLGNEGIDPEMSSEILSPFDTAFQSNQHRSIDFFDSYASGLIILVVLGISLLRSATAITSERATGTIERVFASPYHKSELILGKLLALSIFAILVAFITTASLKAMFDIALGNIPLVLLTATLVGINGVIIGLLISSVTYSEAQSLLVVVLTYLGFIILMTFIWPIETMHPLFTYVSDAVPFTYAIDAIRRLNLLGDGFSDIWIDLAILGGTIILLSVASAVILRREIK